METILLLIGLVLKNKLEMKKNEFIFCSLI